MLRLFRIRGDSLFPLFKDKSLVLAINRRFFKLKKDDVVVFFQKEYGLMIKKIQTIQNDRYFLVGTSTDSIDSKIFGEIPKKDIRYKVLFAIISP